MNYSELIGHVLHGPGINYTCTDRFVVVEYAPSQGLWIVNVTHRSDQRRLRCISEAAVDRTFHHQNSECPRCEMEWFSRLRSVSGTTAADVFRTDVRYNRSSSTKAQ